MLAELTAAASGNAELSLIVGFLAGYLVILVTPGPNMLAVAGIASLQGVRGAAPFCAGVALGAGALGAALLLAIGAAADAVRIWEVAARMVGAQSTQAFAAWAWQDDTGGAGEGDIKAQNIDFDGNLGVGAPDDVIFADGFDG